MIRRPLPRAREKPRRKDPTRVSHFRIKRKASDAPTAEEKAHMARVAKLGCLVCGGGATIHHVSASIHGGRITRSHQRVAPLCPAHHQIQHGPRVSVEALGHSGFHATYGIDLLAEADGLWCESVGEIHGGSDA